MLISAKCELDLRVLFPTAPYSKAFTLWRNISYPLTIDDAFHESVTANLGYFLRVIADYGSWEGNLWNCPTSLGVICLVGSLGNGPISWTSSHQSNFTILTLIKPYGRSPLVVITRLHLLLAFIKRTDVFLKIIGNNFRKVLHPKKLKSSLGSKITFKNKKCKAKPVNKWTRPPLGSFKLNVDGSTFGKLGPIGIGGVIRDHDSFIKGVFSFPIGIEDSNFVEFFAIN
ncbi:Uncharacterized protein TCM_004284 [Theobroma cacao]|uniref:RNase H type-1 domain-containing protein n=1 Tax=Theobroma cacao TaxID=3641 RepID=A0A061DPS7_THECC|nr:Uncharacterized protein TCM_004284 [Theobroma cacao]